jgi:TolB-like protein
VGAGASAAYTFGRFTLDLDRGALLADGTELALRAKSFALLRLFVENPGRLLDRDEIMKTVWPGVFVTDDSIAQCISDIRRALGDGDQKLLRTLPRRGFLFTPQPLRGTEPDSLHGAPASDHPAPASAPSPAQADKPSIAILPFQNMSGDPEQEYFADGMVEEITTALSRIPWLFVVARNSSFTFKGQAVDVKQVGRELGVRYVLEGSVRKAAGRVRITGQLIDAVSGAHLWADRFDGPLEEVFELQDKVAFSVAGVIEPTLQAAETARSAGRPTDDLTAYDLYLRAYAMVLASTRQTPEALSLMEQAIERDPHYGPALAWAAYCCFRLIGDGRSEDAAGDRKKGIEFARRALEVASDDPVILVNAALVLAYFGEDIDAMIALVDRALSLHPSFARGWNISSSLHNWAGHPDIAIEHMETSLRLSPRARVGTSLVGIGSSHFVSRRFDQAAPILLRAIQEDASHPLAYRYLTACYAHMGRLDDARDILLRLRAVTSVVIPDLSYLRNPDFRELFLSGLRIAVSEADQPAGVESPGFPATV